MPLPPLPSTSQVISAQSLIASLTAGPTAGTGTSAAYEDKYLNIFITLDLSADTLLCGLRLDPYESCRHWKGQIRLVTKLLIFAWILRACLYGLGYPRQPSPRDNFTKRLYENCVTETQLTLLDYAYILRRNKHHHLPLFLCSSSFIKYSCVFTFRKWTNTSIL